METKQMIADGKTALGIEFGSTRIKVVLIDKDHHPIASGSHDWENRLENNIWTYTLEDIWSGLQDSYQNLVNDVKEKYDITLTKVGSIGFSAMMHGYMAFDKDGELLVPFRTWRNTMTEEASEKLTEAFSYHIPQRWSIAHLYQAILKEEEHVKDIDYLTTLAGYVHWKLTGEKVLGVGEASGMFPIDIETKDYNQTMIKTFDNLIKDKKFGWKLENILPKVLIAGDKAGLKRRRSKIIRSILVIWKLEFLMSSRRRCRNWNGCDKQRDKKNRKCICRNKCFCNDRFRERIKESL